MSVTPQAILIEMTGENTYTAYKRRLKAAKNERGMR